MSDPGILRRLARDLLPRRFKMRVKDMIRSAVDTKTLHDSHQAAARRIADLEGEVAALRARVGDAEATAEQWAAILRRESGFPPPPPRHLQVRVMGKYGPGYIESGAVACQELASALEPAGQTLRDFGTILDFGCGSGRAIRILHKLVPEARLYGTDIDGEAIAWLQQHYAGFGKFAVAPHHPPTVYSDGQFDFVFAISVFSHLPEDMQFEWLGELQRITRPGGFLVLTTHGEEHYGQLGDEARAIMQTKGFFYSDFGWNYGGSISLPDFYQTAYHSHEYIRREWTRFFEVLEIRALGIEQHQDTVLLRRRPEREGLAT